MIKEQHQHRKDEHLSLAVKYWSEKVQETTDSVFADLSLPPRALPAFGFADVDLSVSLFDHSFEVPFYIEAMTGGTERGDKINRQLAEIAKNQHLALAVGSQSIALKYPELAVGFKKVREIHSNGFLLANLGAGHGLEAAKKAVDMLAANALEIHINVAQELSMSDDEGDRDFSRWLENINEIAVKIEVPVIVKEVGFGMSAELIKQLEALPISAINIGGRGGTNFAWIERQRHPSRLSFENFGYSTLRSLREAASVQSSLPLIATGGITGPEDIFHCLYFGAQLTSSAGYILMQLIKNGSEATEQLLENWKSDLAKIYTLQGVRNIKALHKLT